MRRQRGIQVMPLVVQAWLSPTACSAQHVLTDTVCIAQGKLPLILCPPVKKEAAIQAQLHMLAVPHTGGTPLHRSAHLPSPHRHSQH